MMLHPRVRERESKKNTRGTKGSSGLCHVHHVRVKLRYKEKEGKRRTIQLGHRSAAPKLPARFVDPIERILYTRYTLSLLCVCLLFVFSLSLLIFVLFVLFSVCVCVAPFEPPSHPGCIHRWLVCMCVCVCASLL